MKKMTLLAICALFSTSLYSQQWNGSVNSTGDIFRAGKVSIGTDNNNDKLTLNGNLRLTGNSGNRIVFGGGSTSPAGTIDLDFGKYHFELSGENLYLHPYILAYFGDVDPNIQLKKSFSMTPSGLIGMGTDNFSCGDCTDYRLFVKDGIRTEKVKVDIAADNGWADYVFKKDYNLMSLQDLQNYIDKKGHLPEVPTTEEAIANGVELKEMNILLLKKIEELTLYTLQQQKNIEKQNKRIELLEEKLSK